MVAVSLLTTLYGIKYVFNYYLFLTNNQTIVLFIQWYRVQCFVATQFERIIKLPLCIFNSEHGHINHYLSGILFFNYTQFSIDNMTAIEIESAE
jgi:hypothetical protein